MARDSKFDEMISRWLEESSPSGIPERVLDATFERTRRSRQQLGWRAFLGRFHMPRFLPALGSAAVVVVATAVAFNLYLNQVDLGRPPNLPTTPDAWERVLIETPSGTGDIVSLAANPHRLLAVVRPEGDAPAQLFGSTDGHSWTLVPPDQLPTSLASGPVGSLANQTGATVVGTDQGFLMVGDGVWASDDGYIWQTLASPADDADLQQGRMLAVAVGGPGYVAVGSDNVAWYSTDGSDWSVADVPPPPDAFFAREGYPAPTVDMEGVTVAGDKLVAWGSASATKTGPGDWTLVAPVLWASSDGRSWTNVAGPEGTTAVVAGPGGFIAAGEAGSEDAVWLSADGEIWEMVAGNAFGSHWSENSDGTLVNDEGMPVQLTLRSAAATSAGYVVVGGDGQCLLGSCTSAEAVIWTSVDGHSWSRLPSDDRFKVTVPGDPEDTSGAWAGEVVAWGSRFVVGGTYDDKPAIWISDSARAQPPTTSQPPAPMTGPLPAEQMAIIARHAAALNSRDAEAFVDTFAADGVFDPRGTFAASSSLFSNSLPVADRSLIEPFMAINDAWGFEAEVVTCEELSRSDYDRRYSLHHGDSDLYGHCAVKSRWPTLSLEIGEQWHYEFNGTDIRYWGQAVSDATPVDRALPIGLNRLLEWEAWLESTDPDVAARLLNPRVYPATVPCGEGTTFVDNTHTTTAPPEPPCEWSSEDIDVERITSDGYGRGEDGWVIGGQHFSPSALIPYDPAMAAEIETSIQEFLVR